MEIMEDSKVFEILRNAFEQQLINDGFVEHSGYSLEKNHINAYIDERVECAWFACLQGYRLAKSQAVPEGFVLVKKELPEQIAEKMAIDRIDKPRHENDPVWREIAEQSYKDQVKSKKWEFWRDYKAMIEAQEPTND